MGFELEIPNSTQGLYPRQDGVLSKRFVMKEKVRLEFRVEFFNIFNRHFFNTPDLNMNDSYFGNIWSAGANRSGQAGIRLDW